MTEAINSHPTESGATVPVPEILKTLHTHTVVMPYSSNLKDSEPRRGESRLSFYSAFALNSAYELYKNGQTRKLILCGETTFGHGKKSTTDLMKDALLGLGVPDEDVIILGVPNLDNIPNLDNTALQIKAVAEYQKSKDLQNETFLVVNWQFHQERVRNHIQGFGLNAETVTAEELHKYFMPSFDLEELKRVLPEEFEKREKTPRRISRFDKRGFVPRLLAMLRGPSVTDIQKDYSSLDKSAMTGRQRPSLRLLNTTGRKRLKEIKET